MRNFIEIVDKLLRETAEDDSNQLNEIFGFSQAEKTQKGLAAMGSQITAAMKINNVIEAAEAVDKLCLAAIQQGADYKFFNGLGFKSNLLRHKAYVVPNIWAHGDGAIMLKTVYGAEMLAGPLAEGNKVDPYKAEEYAKQVQSKWTLAAIGKQRADEVYFMHTGQYNKMVYCFDN